MLERAYQLAYLVRQLIALVLFEQFDDGAAHHYAVGQVSHLASLLGCGDAEAGHHRQRDLLSDLCQVSGNGSRPPPPARR